MPHLSDSQIATYEACPEQWASQKMRAVEHVEPSEHLILGSAFHNTIEHDGKRRIMRSNPFSALELTNFFRRNLSDELAQNDPEGKLSGIREKLEARGAAMLRAYSQSVAPKYWPIAVEESFEFLIPNVAPDADGDPWTFQGRIDGRTRMKNGSVVIIDWKTASKPWPAGAEHDKRQASAYILSDIMMGRTPCSEQVTFITFPTRWNEANGTFDCTVDMRPTKRTLTDVADYLATLQRIAREINRIKRGEMLVEARPHWRCQFCNNLRNCESGIKWMMDRNRFLPFDVPGYVPEKPKKRRKRKLTADEENMAILFGEDLYEDVPDDELSA